jgi:hypothetical protein
VTSAPPRRNVELKARDAEPARTLRLALPAGELLPLGFGARELPA